MVRFGSLFTGIGGLDLGLERAGMTCAWQVEISPACRSILARHWPDVPRLEDIREVKGKDVEQVDCLAGGFPCQDVSQAGLRTKGIEGPRSGLWREFARLIREIRPRFVIVENVPGLAVRGLGTVLADLASLGFDAEWGVLSAQDCGAPHLRRRLFVIAARRPVPHTFRSALRDLGQREREQHSIEGAGLTSDARELVADSDGRRWGEGGSSDTGAEIPDASRCGCSMAHRDGRRCEVKRGPQRQPGDEPHRCVRPIWPPSTDDVHAWRAVQASSQPALCRVADGLPGGLDGDLVRALKNRSQRLKALGNAVVPAQAYAIGRRLMACIEDTAA